MLLRSVNEAYNEILDKSKEDPMVMKALSIILAASRPLTLAKINVAVNINKTSQSTATLTLRIKRTLSHALGLGVEDCYRGFKALQAMIKRPCNV